MATPGRGSRDTFASPTGSSPISQYPFPATDPAQRQNASSRGGSRRGSTTSSITAVGSTLDSTLHQRTITETSQNAISTLLQHPIVRTGLQTHSTIPTTGYKAPTQRDIPPVTLTNIPHIEAKTFHPYLSQVGSIYEAFQRAKTEEEGEASLFHRDRKDSRAEEWDAVLSKRLQRPGHSRAGSTTSSIISPLEAPQPKRRGSAQRRNAVTPLSTIPSVYSEEDFHLENPRTFDVVSEHSEIVRDPKAAPSGRKTLAANAILQEKLSWYMDTVEVHLISSISNASKSFFSALGSLRELHAEAADSVDRIQKLRKDLGRLDKEMALDGLKVVNLRQRRENVRQLAEAIMQLEDIVRAVRTCEDMVESGEIDGAMDDLDDLERLMLGKPNLHSDTKDSGYVRRDLRAIKALEGALDDLNHLRLRVGRGYEGRFHSSLLGDIRRHVQNTETALTLQRWGNAFNRTKPGQRRAPSSFPAYMSIGPELRSELEKEMKGLSRARHTTPAASAFRALVLREMKTMIRKQLPSSNEDDSVSTISASTYGGRQMNAQEKSSILARNIRALDGNDWYRMLASIYTNASEALRRLSVQVKILLDITSNLPEQNTKSPPRTPDPASIDQTISPRPSHGRPRSTSSVQAEMQQVLDLSSLLGEAVDLVQNHMKKVINIRSEQMAELSLDEFLRYFTLNRLFTDECEAISGRSGAALKAVLDRQIKEFVYKLGETQRENIKRFMDADKWDAKDFGEHENMILSRVQGGSTDDASFWLDSTTIWQSSAEGDMKASNGSALNGAASTGREKVRSAVIDEQKYILPESAANMLQSIDVSQHLAAGIPSMSQEVANLLLENLKLFNSRASQLILGAGATRVAGLKNITTKHLALSSQALSFIIALVPYIREFFRRHLTTTGAQQIMSEFDKVKRLLQEHQHAIHEKLVDIMAGRASMHVKAMKMIDWEEASKNKAVAVSPYMEVLAKETATLQKVLSKHLPEAVVGGIMTPVFTSYREQWQTAFGDVDLKSMAAKERLLADAEFFEARMSKLEGTGDLGELILNLVKAKQVTTDPAAAVARASMDKAAAATSMAETNVTAEKENENEKNEAS